MSLTDAQKKVLNEIDIWYRAILRKDAPLQPYEARLFKAYAEWRHALKDPVLPRAPLTPAVPPPPLQKVEEPPTIPEMPAFLAEPASIRPSRNSSVESIPDPRHQEYLSRPSDFEKATTKPTPPRLKEALVWRTRIPSPPTPLASRKPKKTF